MARKTQTTSAPRAEEEDDDDDGRGRGRRGGRGGDASAKAGGGGDDASAAEDEALARFRTPSDMTPRVVEVPRRGVVRGRRRDAARRRYQSALHWRNF